MRRRAEGKGAVMGMTMREEEEQEQGEVQE